MIDRGIVIEYEGLDSAGKNTQIKLTESALIGMGYKVVTYSFPNYNSTIGNVISDYLTGEYGSIESINPKLISTAYAADRARFAEDIATYVDNDYIVLIDRYTYSNVFSAAKMPESEWDNFINWVEDLEFKCLNVYKPDYVFYLHVDPEISIQRIKERGKREYQNGKNDIHESNNELLISAARAYQYFASKKNNWITINEMNDNGGQKTVDEVFSTIFGNIIDVLK